jgi:hypothetical protein
MTLPEVAAYLKHLGVKKKFWPIIDKGFVLFKTKDPIRLHDGEMSGCEILLHGRRFKVLVDKKAFARRIAKKYDLPVRYLDDMAELILPASLADVLLPQFGAKRAYKSKWSPRRGL